MSVTTLACRTSLFTTVDSAKASKPLSSASQSTFVLRGTAAHALVKFGLPRDLVGAVVVSAIIEWRSSTALTGSRTPTARALTGPFRSTTTHNNQPGVGTVRNGTFTGPAQAAVDATADFQAVADGATYHGHRLSNSETTARTWLGPKHPTGYPRLTLTYAREMPAPLDVTPRGVVAIAKPIFSWAAPAGVLKVQAQADVAGGSFTNPTWTSAEIPSTIGQVNTDTAGWAGLAAGGSASLRFRQLGPLGWSPYSQPVTVTRQDLATLTTTAPTAGGTTNDVTPEHQWSFASQSKFQLQLLSAAGEVLYDSGEVSGADQSWTPPATLRVSATSTIRSRLRTWDSRTDRTASPGDLGYRQTEWTWTVEPSGSTAAPTALTVATTAGRANLTLSWSRAAGEPDEWAILRDGVIFARFPGAVGRNGTNWSYEDWTCPPNTTTTYSVVAIVAGKMSAPASATAVKLPLSGVVIVEPISGAWVNIAGAAATGDLEQTETTLTYKGPYAQAPTWRVLALGGIDGPIAGELVPEGDRPVAQQVAAAQKIRSYPTRTCRLLSGMRNIPVRVSRLSVGGPTPEATRRRLAHRISLYVEQNGEFPTPVTGQE
ncbi:hypothetical protein [Nocardioides marmoraquaticus]